MITNNLLNKGGRIGNQMFQYANLLGIKALKGYDIVLSKEHMNSSMIQHTFDLSEYTAEDEENLKFNSTVCESSHCFDSKILEVKDNTNLRGYFQTEKYFKHCSDLIRREFTFKNDTIKEVENFLQPYLDRTLVSIHIRRTDYLVYTHIHEKCGLLYYNQAIKILDTPNTQFIVVSDDIEWCKKNLNISNVVFSHGSYDFDLCIQSRCEHHIISNSTFSWWGAWLGTNINKKVIAPQYWFTENYNKTSPDYDIIPENWIKLNNI
jgi:hypothetical protein